MIFNSIDFAVFFPIIFILYWFLFNRDLRLQNLLLLVASYIFYGWWDWRFLSLVFISSLTDYLVAFYIPEVKQGKRKLLLWVSISMNIGLLLFFKYFNFFIDSFVTAFNGVGVHLQQRTLNIILPVGISFYTFQTLSYTIDVYREKIRPTRDVIAFFTFVSFFPQLVAGPIERASNLLPQFFNKRIFTYQRAVDGLRLTIWGLFKKVVIADSCARYVDEIFESYTGFSGSTLLLGAILFGIQIYGDFSGYSDIAIGIARILGFDLMKNFNYPYFSRDIAEFWRRWHISLSTWFRDYVYIPLGGSRGTLLMQVRNVFIIFLVSGFWHGANWTFLAWGFIHASLFLPLLILKLNRRYTTQPVGMVPGIRESLKIVTTFLAVNLAWIFFRSPNIHDAWNYLTQIFSTSLFSMPEVFPRRVLIILVCFMGIEWVQKSAEHAFEISSIKPRALRWGIYTVLILLIISFYQEEKQFIYFQF